MCGVKIINVFHSSYFLVGGCKHALAFLMWVHRRSEEPSPTDITSYWMKPRLSAVGTSTKFITAANFSKTSSLCPPSTSNNGTTFMEQIVAIGLREKLPGQILKYASDVEQDKFNKLSMYKQLFQFHAQGGVKFEDFLSFMSMGQISVQLCKEAEYKTKGQSVSPLWHELRFGRVTASKLFEFAHCTVAEGTLVETIIGAYKLKDTKYMKRGRLLEKDVLKTVEKQLKIKFKNCGLFILPSHPLFAASPDAISSEFIVEVKCPASEKSVTNYVKNGQITGKFKAQMQLQMLCAQKKRGIFCVASPEYEQTKNVQIFYENFDETFSRILTEKASTNWEKYVFPKLYKSVC